MSKNHRDLVNELIELCQELVTRTLQQVGYYRASVYKIDARTVILNQIEELRGLLDLLQIAEVAERFDEYMDTVDYLEGKNEASTVGNSRQFCDSDFILCTNKLLRKVEGLIANYRPKEYVSKKEKRDLAVGIKRNRKKIISVCQVGSRSWQYFNEV